MTRYRFLVPSVVAISLLAGLAILLALATHGFNLLDEAFYAVWISSPERFEFSIQPFGLFFHPFYDLLQQSIVALRLLGIVMLAASGALLGWAVARYCRVVLDLPANLTLSLILLGALFQLTYYVLWIPTPSYNLLANVSAAMIFAGALGWLTTRPAEPNSGLDRLSSVLVGLGGCYAFFAKPPFAAVAAIAVLFVLLLRTVVATGNRGRLFERVAIAGASCIVPLYLHIVYVMPIPDFVTTIEGGMAAMNIGNSPSDLPLKTFNEFRAAGYLFLASGLALLVAAVWRTWQPSFRSKGAEVAAAALLAANVWSLGVAVAAVVFDDRIYWDAFGPELVALVLAQIAFGLVRNSSGPVDPRAIGLLLALVALPFAIAFGTANPLPRQTSVSMFGALLASAVAAPVLFKERTARMVLCGLAIAALASIVGAAMNPYRVSKPAEGRLERITIPRFQGALLVDKQTKQYASYLQSVARRGRLAPEVPVLDLSGGGPGTALFLGGRPAGNPWLGHFFDNAAPMADAFWRTLGPEDQARAWIVGPIHPKFSGSAVGKQLIKERSRYACLGLTSMTFWDESMPVSVWKPSNGEIKEVPGPSECADANMTAFSS